MTPSKPMYKKRHRQSGRTPRAPQTPKHVLPSAAFTVGAAAYPLFIWALGQCELDGASFFVLSSIRAGGKKYPANGDGGRPAKLHSDLTSTLVKVLGIQVTNVQRADELIKQLHVRGLVQKIDPTDDPRPHLADNPSAERTKVVVLTPAGEAVLDRLNGYINECVDELIGSVSAIKRTTIGYLARRLVRHEKDLVNAAQRLAERKEMERRELETTVD